MLRSGGHDSNQLGSLPIEVQLELCRYLSTVELLHMRQAHLNFQPACDEVLAKRVIEKAYHPVLTTALENAEERETYLVWLRQQGIAGRIFRTPAELVEFINLYQNSSRNPFPNRTITVNLAALMDRGVGEAILYRFLEVCSENVWSLNIIFPESWEFIFFPQAELHSLLEAIWKLRNLKSLIMCVNGDWVGFFEEGSVHEEGIGERKNCLGVTRLTKLKHLQFYGPNAIGIYKSWFMNGVFEDQLETLRFGTHHPRSYQSEPDTNDLLQFSPLRELSPNAKRLVLHSKFVNLPSIFRASQPEEAQWLSSMEELSLNFKWGHITDFINMGRLLRCLTDQSYSNLSVIYFNSDSISCRGARPLVRSSKNMIETSMSDFILPNVRKLCISHSLIRDASVIFKGFLKVCSGLQHVAFIQPLTFFENKYYQQPRNYIQTHFANYSTNLYKKWEMNTISRISVPEFDLVNDV